MRFILSGIIPAHAGNTISDNTKGVHARDHPRACGEHRVRGRKTSLREGSSPRMRGTLAIIGVTAIVLGIIPAHAGNTQRNTGLRFACWDHPRACGEHFLWEMTCFHGVGSSPRMRGTHFPYLRDEFTGGIIPAHAGNTRSRRAVRAWKRDHPRACGEHFRVPSIGFTGEGSSPRMRGTP